MFRKWSDRGYHVRTLSGVAYAPGADPDFSSVSALLHCDGANNSTAFADSSTRSANWTGYGNAKISTSESKFGGASAVFDGNADYIRPASDAAFAFGTGDFTIELWFNMSSLANAPCIYDWRPPSTTAAAPGLFIGLVTSQKLSYYNGSSGVITGATTISTGVWHHVAVSRSSGVTRMYLNGTQEGSSYTDTNNYATTQPTFGALGYDTSLTAYAVNGYLDEIRITKAVGRYTANFAAPTAAFPTF